MGIFGDKPKEMYRAELVGPRAPDSFFACMLAMNDGKFIFVGRYEHGPIFRAQFFFLFQCVRAMTKIRVGVFYNTGKLVFSGDGPWSRKLRGETLHYGYDGPALCGGEELRICRRSLGPIAFV